MDNTKTIRISEIFGPTIQGEGALIGQPTVFVRTGGCDYRCSWCDTLHAVDNTYRTQWLPMTAADIFARVQELSGGQPLMVSLSGGNPAIQPLGDLIALGKTQGYKFALETQGSIAKDWFRDLDVLTLSPKPPSSGMVTDYDMLDKCVVAAGVMPTELSLSLLRRGCPEGAGEGYSDCACIEDTPHPVRSAHHLLPKREKENFSPQCKIALKFVVFDDADYDFAKTVAAHYPQLPVYLQPGNHTPPPADDHNATVDMNGIMARMRWLVDKTIADKWFAATVLPQLHVLIWGNLRGV